MIGYDLLLRRLDADEQRAATQYEALRGKLSFYFAHRDCLFPEDLADETLHRVARRLGEGEDIRAGNLTSYCFGIAKNIRYEQRRQPGFSHEEALPDSHLASQPEAERIWEREEEQRRLGCLKKCLRRLPGNERELIESYYHDEDRIQAAQRDALARRLKLAAVSLRSGAHRIRRKLERCVKSCLNQ